MQPPALIEDNNQSNNQQESNDPLIKRVDKDNMVKSSEGITPPPPPPPPGGALAIPVKEKSSNFSSFILKAIDFKDLVVKKIQERINGMKTIIKKIIESLEI